MIATLQILNFLVKVAAFIAVINGIPFISPETGLAVFLASLLADYVIRALAAAGRVLSDNLTAEEHKAANRIKAEVCTKLSQSVPSEGEFAIVTNKRPRVTEGCGNFITTFPRG